MIVFSARTGLSGTWYSWTHGAVARRGQRAPGWGDVKVAVCAAKLADKSCTKLDAAKIYNQEVP